MIDYQPKQKYQSERQKKANTFKKDYSYGVYQPILEMAKETLKMTSHYSLKQWLEFQKIKYILEKGHPTLAIKQIEMHISG